LHRIVEELLPRLPNLKAIIFEIFPSFVPVVGLDLVRDQLAWLHEVWDRRKPAAVVDAKPVSIRSIPEKEDLVPPPDWERALGRLVTGRAVDDLIGRELAEEPGAHIVERLIHEFRGSMIVRVLPLTSRYLMLTVGPDAFRTILADFWSKVTPQMYGSVEATSFAAYMKELDLRVPHLAKILEFEEAVTATNIDGLTRSIKFGFEPLPLLRAISESRLPDEPPRAGDFEIELTGDELSAEAGSDLEAARQSSPFH
jgi:hypothetical protein